MTTSLLAQKITQTVFSFLGLEKREGEFIEKEEINDSFEEAVEALMYEFDLFDED